MRPVVLVHGYLASPGLMLPLQTRLREHGHDVHLVPELSRGVAGDVRCHAEELDRAVERVRAHTGADRVDLVGASQGGIIALWWAAGLDRWDRVGRLVAIGAPFRGSRAARVARPLMRWVSRGIDQLVPGSELLEDLASAELARPVVSVAMANDPVCPPETCVLPGMEQVVVPGRYGLLSHQLLMLDPRAARAVHEALVSDAPSGE